MVTRAEPPTEQGEATELLPWQDELSDIADDFNAAGRELGGPFWHELLDEQRCSIFKTAVRYAARRPAPHPPEREPALSVEE